MSKKPILDHEFFTEFTTDPKGSSMETILGAHRFLAAVIDHEDDGPTLKVLMKIFRPFIPESSIKDYIFKRIKKPLLLELALCILQDVASNGVSRLATLTLAIEKTRSGAKDVVVEPIPERSDDESVEDGSFLHEIDEIFFKFGDSSGDSPDVKFAAGAGHSPSYSPPDAKGNFVTPAKRGVPKTLFPTDVSRSCFAIERHFLHGTSPFLINLQISPQAGATTSREDLCTGTEKTSSFPQVNCIRMLYPSACQKIPAFALVQSRPPANFRFSEFRVPPKTRFPRKKKPRKLTQSWLSELQFSMAMTQTLPLPPFPLHRTPVLPWLRAQASCIAEKWQT